MTDLDQSGHGFQRIRTYLGPSLGWTDEIVQPINTVTTAGTYVVKPGDSMILVNVAGLVTIQLPDVREWVQQNANQPATGFERSITVKDMGGNAQAFNISITPFDIQTIDGIAAPVVIVINRASTRLYPLADMTGWVVESTAVGGPGANGDVFKAGNNTFTGTNTFNGPVFVPTMSLDDSSTHAANTAFVKGQGYISTVDLTAYAKLDSPNFIGTPTAPTQMALTSDGTIATTFYVNRGFQPLDGDLTAIAALTGTNSIYYRSGSSIWSPVVVAAPLTFVGGVLGTAAGGGNVTSVGTPTNGQIAQWTGPTSIQGVAAATLGFQPLDADLTALAGVTTNDRFYYRVADGNWQPVTVGANLSFTGGTLAGTGGGGSGTVNSTGGGYSTTTLSGYADGTGNVIRAVTVSTGLNLTVGGVLTCTVSTAGFAPLASPVFTGDPQAPTPLTADNDTSIATTAFVKAQGYATTASVTAGFQPLDADLTSIAAASATDVLYYRSAANTWSPVTIGGGLTFATGILSAAGGGGNVSSVGTPAATQVAQWTSASQIQGVPLTTWRTTSTFYGVTTFNGGAGGNNLTIEGRPSTQNVWVRSTGTDTNVGMSFSTKAGGSEFFYTADFANLQVAIVHQAVAGYLQMNGGDGTTNIQMVGGANTVGIANANLTGTPTAPTQSPGDSTTKIATTAFVAAAAGGGSGFSTGDVKATIKTVADAGWVMMNDGSIGSATSGATYANVLANALFLLIFANLSDANAAIQTSTGTGTTRAAQGTAAAAWAANCRIFLPKVLGRAMAGAGSGSGLTARTLGQILGEEAHVQTSSEMSLHNHACSLAFNANVQASYVSFNGGSTYNASLWGSYSTGVNNPDRGGNVAANVMQPTTFLNFMIKL